MLEGCPKSRSAQARKLAVAALALSAFGCATVRAPLASFDEPVPVAPGGSIEPHLELWLEAGDEIPEAEQREALEDARATLAEVVGTHTISASALGAADPLLFVRERAVARTASRRESQTVAKVAIVAGVVLVVVALVAGGKGSSGGSVAHAGGGLGHVSAHLAVPRTAGALAASAPRALPAQRGWTQGARLFTGAGDFVHPGRPRRPIGRYADPGIADAYLDLLDPGIDLGLEAAAQSKQGAYAPISRSAESDAWDPAPPASPEAAEAPPPELELPDMEPFALDDRGFFAGDLTQLQLDLIDRASGRLLWSNRVEKEIDPRDPDELDALLTDALAGEPWTRSGAGAPRASR